MTARDSFSVSLGRSGCDVSIGCSSTRFGGIGVFNVSIARGAIRLIDSHTHHTGAAATLCLAMEHYGEHSTDHGSVDCKAVVIRVVVDVQLPISFVDPVLEGRWQGEAIKAQAKRRPHRLRCHIGAQSRYRPTWSSARSGYGHRWKPTSFRVGEGVALDAYTSDCIFL